MSADRYQQYFPKIEANRRKLESFISEIKKTESGPPDQAWRRILFAHLALDFASSHSTGLYTSEIIEKVFLDMAGKHRIFDVYPPVEKKHVLHVVTRTYLTGGHTRVLERWVAQAEADEKHSLVFLSQEDKDQIPPKLQDSVLEKGGDFLLYDHSESMLERALKLRRLAQAREYVVLHVHPSDPIPLGRIKMNKALAKIICCFIPSKAMRRKVRDIFGFGLFKYLKALRASKAITAEPGHYLAICAIAKDSDVRHLYQWQKLKSFWII